MYAENVDFWLENIANLILFLTRYINNWDTVKYTEIFL